MPLTKLDEICALIVIDLQKGIVGMPTVHPSGEIVDRADQLARAFRGKKLPVVLVNVSGGAPGRTDAGIPKFARADDWTELVPELDQQPTDHVITKQRVGAFIGSNLDEYLRKQGVTQVFLAGISTSFGVESTARSAFDLGYNVVFVVDAMTDRNADAHRLSAEMIFPKLGETETTANVLKVLKDGRAS